MNNPFVVESSTSFARRLLNADATKEGRIEHAFEIAFSRKPTSREIALCKELASDTNNKADWALFCHGLIASNEFLYVH